LLPPPVESEPLLDALLRGFAPEPESPLDDEPEPESDVELDPESEELDPPESDDDDDDDDDDESEDLLDSFVELELELAPDFDDRLSVL
jgi:hypothetical protein